MRSTWRCGFSALPWTEGELIGGYKDVLGGTDGDALGLGLVEDAEDPSCPRLARVVDGMVIECCVEFGPISAVAKISAEATTRRSEDV